MSGSDVLERLAETVRAEGGLLGEAVADAPRGEPARHGALAAAGPRAAGHEAEYELLVEAIREGYLLHYGEGRVVAPDDPDLALLAGDRLYALGLARLAELGDLEAVALLAEVISLSAQAHAAADPGRAEAVWEAGALAVGRGGSPETLRELSRQSSQGAETGA
jgi:hypothetical protein